MSDRTAVIEECIAVLDLMFARPEDAGDVVSADGIARNKVIQDCLMALVKIKSRRLPESRPTPGSDKLCSCRMDADAPDEFCEVHGYGQPQAASVSALVERLRYQADQIADGGHYGWGNTMREAADAIAALTPTPAGPWTREQLENLALDMDAHRHPASATVVRQYIATRPAAPREDTAMTLALRFVLSWLRRHGWSELADAVETGEQMKRDATLMESSR